MLPRRQTRCFAAKVVFWACFETNAARCPPFPKGHTQAVESQRASRPHWQAIGCEATAPSPSGSGSAPTHGAAPVAPPLPPLPVGLRDSGEIVDNPLDGFARYPQSPP